MLTLDQAATEYSVTVIRVENAEYRIIGFERTEGPAVLFFKVIDQEGAPEAGQRVLVINGGDQITNPTNEHGITDLPMGAGSWYDPAEGQGPHRALLHEVECDVVHGLGMVHHGGAGTNHVSLMTIWQKTGGGNDMNVQVVDEQGAPVSDHDFRQLFQHAGVVPYEDQRFACVKLIWRQSNRDSKPHPLTITVLDTAGNPIESIGLVVSRDGVPADSGTTRPDGTRTFQMDDDWRYSVPSEPAWAVGINKREDGGSDAVKVGWVHRQHRWLDVVFQERGGVEKPGKPEFGEQSIHIGALQVPIECEGADSLHYSLDGPGYHKGGETPLHGLFVGLTPSTTYTLKVWGRNDAGDGPDAYLEFTTLADDDPPPVPPDWDDLVRTAITALDAAGDALEALLDAR